MSLQGVLTIVSCIAIGGTLSYGAYTDYKKRIIPNIVPLSILVLGCFTAIPWLNKIISLGVMVLVLVLTTLISKKKSGGGDIKVYCALSFALGLETFILILVVTLLEVFIEKLIRKIRKEQNRDGNKNDEKTPTVKTIPLCTFIAPAYIIVMIGLTILSAVWRSA